MLTFGLAYKNTSLQHIICEG